MTRYQISINYDKFAWIYQVVGVVFADNNDVYILNTLTFIFILIVTLNAEKVILVIISIPQQILYFLIL